jgi:hypothetical protein
MCTVPSFPSNLAKWLLRLLRLLGSGLFFAPLVGHAQEMAVFFVEGSKPARIVYALEFLDIRDRTPTLDALVRSKQGGDDYRKLLEDDKRVALRIVAVHEHPSAPESVDMSVEIICKPPGQFQIQNAHALLRDGNQQFPTQGWRALTAAASAWPVAAAAVACRREQVMQIARLPQDKANAALKELGLVYVGDRDRFELTDVIWQSLLADGKRPAYTEKEMTEQERKTQLAQLDAALASAKAEIAAGLAMAGASLGEQQSEREFKAQLAKRRQAAHPHLQWLMGLTEREVVNSSGAPAATLGDAAGRVLVYSHVYDIPGVGVVLDGNGQRVATSTTVSCEVQISFAQGGSVREGRAVSYRLLASNGGCRDLRWLNRLAK